MLERADDMIISGTRHPFLFDYKIALDNDGRFLDLNVHCYNNAGYLVELSKGVLERCIVHIDNVYRFANTDIYGQICNTHCASNTAFRGFGGPQGMFATETIIQHAAEELNLDIDKVIFILFMLNIRVTSNLFSLFKYIVIFIVFRAKNPCCPFVTQLIFVLNYLPIE